MLRYPRLARHPEVFRAMTGLTVAEFDALVAAAVPAVADADRARLSRPGRKRAVGAGHPTALAPRDQVLLTVVWLRRYPTDRVLGYLFGVDEATVRRTRGRVLPVLAALGRATMRLPDPGKFKRPALDALLAETPALAVLVDTFEQPVQRPQDRGEADTYYSGKKKRHTLKSQVAVEEQQGGIADVAESARGPTHDLTLLKASGLLDRLPPQVGALGDLIYVGIAAAPPGRVGRHAAQEAPRQGAAPRGRGLQPRLRAAAGEGRACDPPAAGLREPDGPGPPPPTGPHGAGRGRGRAGQPPAGGPRPRGHRHRRGRRPAARAPAGGRSRGHACGGLTRWGWGASVLRSYSAVCLVLSGA